jgi:dTDP-4-amino-4,6-dideoxygalactose transaminase
MSISRFYSIPRFACPYTLADFAAGFQAILDGVPHTSAFPLFGGAAKFWTRSGRQALSLLLRSLRLKPGSGVAIPLFTDPSLFRAIVAAGHHPVFLDIHPEYLTMDPDFLKDCRGTYSAVVAVHLFGQPAEMPAVLEAAGYAPVIEDAAHAPFSQLGGRPVGTFGVAAFYSFASTKYWPAGGGGMAVVNDPGLAKIFEEEVNHLAPSSRLREVRDLGLQIAKAAVFHRRVYGICGKPVRRWIERWALLEPILDQSTIQRPWGAVACRQASRLASRVQSQRASSLQLLMRLAGAEGVVLPHERPGARCNYHLFPVLVRNRQERAAAIAGMWSRFVDTSMIYCNVVDEARRFGYQGSCPIAESVADRMMTLPNYAGLAAEDIDRVADAFRSSLAACRKS